MTRQSVFQQIKPVPTRLALFAPARSKRSFEETYQNQFKKKKKRNKEGFN